MLKFKYIHAAAVAAIFTALIFPSGASPGLVISNSEPNIVNGTGSESLSVLPDSIAATSTFYSVRRDLRRCISPLCGGYFVKRVNAWSTRCANGRFMRECYVAEIDWNGQPQGDNDMLVRGHLIARRYRRFGNLGELRVSESWMRLGTNQSVGTFYLVGDRGIRCITFPCPTHHEAKLNSTFSRNIAGVNFAGAGLAENDASVAQAAMTGPNGLIAAGRDVPVTGPGGRSFELRATQVYVRGQRDSSSMKPCIKTGCSSQVCSDHNVMTTCEWRPEYACYQKATCERQRDGNCGFTRTPELLACLSKP